MHRTPDLGGALQRRSVAQATQAVGMDGDVGGFLEETEDSWRDGWPRRGGRQKSSSKMKAFTAWPDFWGSCRLHFLGC